MDALFYCVHKNLVVCLKFLLSTIRPIYNLLSIFSYNLSIQWGQNAINKISGKSFRINPMCVTSITMASQSLVCFSPLLFTTIQEGKLVCCYQNCSDLL